MNCAWCRNALVYLHGHAACVDDRCQMYGLNQAECCEGETAIDRPLPTSAIPRGPANRQ